MKKVLFAFFLGLACLELVWSNPLPSFPNSFISEFMYDENGHWVLEFELGYVEIDSLFISSSLTKSKVNVDLENNFDDPDRLLVVKENDGTVAPLNINPAGDSLTLVVFYTYEGISRCPLVFGNYENARVGVPGKGQSLVMVSNDYSGLWEIRDVDADYAKCSQPSIGDYNNTDFAQATIKGRVYKSGVPYIDDSYYSYSLGNGYTGFLINEEGLYEANVFANRCTYDTIWARRWPNDRDGYIYRSPIEEFTFELEPGSVVEQDIYIMEDLVTGVKQTIEKEASVLKLYPNPTTGMMSFEVNVPVATTDSYIEFVNSAGQMIFQYPVKDNEGTIDLPAGLSADTYIAGLVVNGKKYDCVKVVLSR